MGVIVFCRTGRNTENAGHRKEHPKAACQHPGEANREPTQQRQGLPVGPAHDEFWGRVHNKAGSM